MADFYGVITAPYGLRPHQGICFWCQLAADYWLWYYQNFQRMEWKMGASSRAYGDEIQRQWTLTGSRHRYEGWHEETCCRSYWDRSQKYDSERG